MRCLILFAFLIALPGISVAQVAERFENRMEELGVLADRIVGVETGRVPEALTLAILAHNSLDSERPISEQLAGMNLGAMRMLERRTTVMHLSRLLEERASERELAGVYAATVFYGRNCYGYADAVRGLARQRIESAGDDVWLALAALPRSPSLYLRDRSALKARVDLTIDQMEAQNMVTSEVAERLRDLKLANVDSGRGCSSH